VAWTSRFRDRLPNCEAHSSRVSLFLYNPLAKSLDIANGFRPGSFLPPATSSRRSQPGPSPMLQRPKYGCAPKPGALPGRAMPRLYRFTDSKSLPRTAPSGACLRTVFGFSTPSHRLKGEGHFCSGGQKLRMRKSLVLASTFSRIAGSGSMRAISIAPIIVEKIAKKARSLSEVRRPGMNGIWFL